MTLVEALILGLIQGLTEFLPVSSSGHLVLAEHLLELSTDDITFEVAIHFATLMAVVVFFFRSLIDVFFSPIRVIFGDRSEATRKSFRLFIIVCIGTVPAVIVGLLFKDRIEAAFSSAAVVSVLLLITSAILFLTRFLTRTGATLNLGNGFLIGCAQALAILPGISRSGSTISMALFCGIDREKAFNFSFILSLPAIVGASILTLMDMLDTGAFEMAASYLVGMAAAFASGYLSLILLRRLVIGGRFHLFGFYTLIVGLAGLIFLK